ncbi:hypothetical protein T8K17_13200 [Thalassobaculum sp. OXR-137]|uniref:hypothetical protein n=1 Tax=Thalassobaculum sp. OXR-137 TaxID=3100173 RepID=UPI002AC9B6D0|nr:hypothetical protein [Thalassobaculum sp. OXR-137]WPZ32198.1 hypothetical protein T8K17_13200 [Thalassobaculum sp. OXR-137]
MTAGWNALDRDGQEIAATVFVALDAARALSDGAARSVSSAARPSPSAIWSALATGRPLPAGIEADADLDALLADAAAVAFPRPAAAATPQAASLPASIDRRAEGARIRVVASRGAPGQSYVTVALEETAVPVTRLIVVLDARAPVEVALPAPRAGAIQLLVDDADPLLGALRDADARLYLV